MIINPLRERRCLPKLQADVPSLDECRHAVMSVMEEKMIAPLLIREMQKDKFYVLDWSMSRTHPIFLKSRVANLIHKFGCFYVERCFLEWKAENLSEFIEKGDKDGGDSDSAE